MEGAVGGHDADRVACPVHESGDDEPALVQTGVLRRHADLRRPVSIQGEHGLPRRGRAARYHGGDVGGTNRQPYTLCHVTTFIAAAVPRITADHRIEHRAERGATIGFMDSGPVGPEGRAAQRPGGIEDEK